MANSDPRTTQLAASPAPLEEGEVAPTLHAIVAAQAARDPDAEALAAPDRAPLSYGRLLAQIEQVAFALAAMGVRRGERVAIALPGGPDTASAFLGVAAHTACAPLDPRSVAGEVDSYLTALGARALVVQGGHALPAREVAEARGIMVVEISPRAEAGAFSLHYAGGRAPAAPLGPGASARAEAGDVALLLRTSGTTSKPKIVPLSHANLAAAARATASVLDLSPRDRCLGVMPLHHVHGLNAVLASLVAGASVLCPRVFDPSELPGWILAYAPTWLTAAPTMHHAMLEAALRHPEMVARRSFRFLRSASAPMPPQMLAEIERVFGVPFIEAYGMTEAASPIASNPLPPGRRKLGSVGRPAGTEVAILDAEGRRLPAGRAGEVAARGPNVMRGYEGDPEADRAVLAGGWLRTGDEGYLDDEGYLFITGRLKEMINRGGEKIAPREVDEALLAHPAVAEAVSFSVRHPSLGEDVAAAVVLRPGASATGRDLSSFVASRLSDFKVPRRIVFVDAIPRGATAKVQRIGLAEKLGLSGDAAGSADAPKVAPRDAVEEAIARIWGEVLGVSRIGVHDDFFELGGHSLHVTQVLARVRAELGGELGLADFFAGPTIEALAKAAVAEKQRTGAEEAATMLAALEGMSEEDAERLLAERGG